LTELSSREGLVDKELDTKEPIHDAYRLSFTFGGLLVAESRLVAQEYLRTPDWEQVRQRILAGNLMKKTRTETTRRYVREIRPRLESAYEWEFSVVAGSAGSEFLDSDVPTVLFAIVTRYYQLLGDFVTQVVRRRFVEGLGAVDTAHFRSFLADQEPAHPEIPAVSEWTRTKLSTVSIRILREAGVLSKPSAALAKPRMSEALRAKYCEEGHREDHREDFGHLLWTDEEVQQCTR
jgi:hypothetical protein